jgi:hypothetical protein
LELHTHDGLTIMLASEYYANTASQAFRLAVFFRRFPRLQLRICIRVPTAYLEGGQFPERDYKHVRACAFVANDFQLKESPLIRSLALVACLIPAASFAQSNPDHQSGGGADPQMMQHHHMMHEEGAAGNVPTQPGQGAFAAIQEIVGILEADPKTD